MFELDKDEKVVSQKDPPPCETSMWAIPSSAFRPAVVPEPATNGLQTSIDFRSFRRRRSRLSVLRSAIETRERGGFVPETKERGIGDYHKGGRGMGPSAGAGPYPVYSWNKGGGGAGFGGNSGAENSWNSSSMAMPPVPKNFAQVDALNNIELERLMKDKVHLEGFIKNLEHCRLIENKVSNLAALVDELEIRAEEMQRNQCTEEANLKINELKAKEAAHRQELNDTVAKRDAWLARNTPSHLIERLRESVKLSDIGSQKTKDEYLQGGMKCADFVRAYVKERSVAHQRGIKLHQYQQNLRFTR